MMFEQVSWKARIGIILSFVWVILVLAITGSELSCVAIFGILPLIVVWGAAWSIQGYFAQRKILADSGNTPAKYKINWKKIGLNVAAFILAFLIATFYAKDYAAELSGQWLVYACFAYLISKALSQAKQYSSTIASFVFAVGLIISSFMRYEETHKAVTELKTILPILSELYEGRIPTEEQFKEYKLGRMEPLVRALADLHQESRAVWSQYESDIAGAKLEILMTTRNLGVASGRENIQLNLKKLQSAITRLEANAKLVYEKGRNKVEMASAILPDEYKKNVMAGIKRSLDSNSKWMERFMANQWSVYKTLLSILEVVNKSNPAYISSGDGVLQFKNEVDLADYKRLNVKLQSLEDEETKIIGEIRAVQNKRARELVEVLENH